MKEIFNKARTVVLAIGLAGAAISASAQQSFLPTYKTLSGTGTTKTDVIFPQNPSAQIRLVSVITSSDLASSTVSFWQGSTAHYVTQTNLDTTSTNMIVESTNGLTAAKQVYFQGASSNILVGLWGVMSTNILTTNSTGLVVTNAWGWLVLSNSLTVTQPLNAEVELMTAIAPSLGVGATTNKAYASDGLCVGNYGRALMVRQTGTSYSSVDAATVHYDGASQ